MDTMIDQGDGGGRRGRWYPRAGAGRSVAWLGAVAAALGAVAAAVDCGGTTGRENIPQPEIVADAGATIDANADATVAMADDGGEDATIDVNIEYADAARIPKYEAGVDAGADAAPLPAWADWTKWPKCGCDHPDPNSPNGYWVDDAGSCSSFVWLPTAAMQDCFINSNPAMTDNGLFPPGCSLVDAGVASSGRGSRQPKIKLAADLYYCALEAYNPNNPNHLKFANIQDVYCGTSSQGDCAAGHAIGPCKDQFEAAFSIDPSDMTSVQRALDAITSWGQSLPGWPGAGVLSVIAMAYGGDPDCASADMYGADAGRASGN